MGTRTYTYRGEARIALEKSPDQFVIRALPQELERMGIVGAEQVSSGSSRITVRTADLERLMSQARHVAPTHHAYQMAETGQEFLVTDRVFVAFREPLLPEKVDGFASRYGLVKLETYSDREYLYQLTEHAGMNPVKLVVKLTEDDPLIASADHDLNYRMSTYQVPVPADPAYLRQWHLHARLQHADFDPRASSRCEDAWQLLGNYGDPQIVVGVTDDGCKLSHRDLDSPGKYAGWGYFQGRRLITDVDVDADPEGMYQSGANHGTSCAGVIAGEADAVLTVGAAPACQLLPIKWESEGPYLLISDSKMLTVLEYVSDKVDVLSNSWGGAPTNVWHTAVRDRIAELGQAGGRRGRGIVFLWAAGNENCPIQHTASVDVPYTSGWSVRPDGSASWVGVRTARTFENNLVGVPGVMHVAALASTAQRSHYSNYGTGITLCAPTNNIHKYHRRTVRGLGVTTTTGKGSGVTYEFGGTSSATPLVAGIAALVLSANPELTALDVISILKQTASKDLSLQGYPPTPEASYDADTAWDVSPIPPFDQGDLRDIQDPDGTWSPWYGHGRVDAAAAVAEAGQRREQTVRELRYVSSHEVTIPDNDPSGVEDILHVPDAGRLRDLQVELGIAHTWIGDLRVFLAAPDGTRALLHDRSGSSRDNIRETYDVTTAPALASLRGLDISGDWTLHVQDLASRDVGILVKWALILTASSGPLAASDDEAVEIPDKDPGGVVRSLDLPSGHTIGEIAVSVDITHPWVGDLQVTLTHPDGTSVRLHDRAGGSRDNLVETWHSRDVPGLQALHGLDTGGAWQLQVTDMASRDVGKLNRWQIEITE